VAVCGCPAVSYLAYDEKNTGPLVGKFEQECES
jgi:hypothetical protein